MRKKTKMSDEEIQRRNRMFLLQNIKDKKISEYYPVIF